VFFLLDKDYLMKLTTICLAVIPFWGIVAHAAINVDLGTANSFAVLAGSEVTNTGLTTIHGDLGVWPGTEIAGFAPGIVSDGSMYSAGAVAMQAQFDAFQAYSDAEAQDMDSDLTGFDLGGLTLLPGVYKFDSSAQLTGTLTLDGQGDANAVFIFQIGSTLTTASASSVVFTNGGQGNNIYWQVGSSATLGTGTQFQGNILALTSITMTTGATIDLGRAFALNGAVTMDSNRVTAINAVPEPGTALIFGSGLVFCLRASIIRRGRAYLRHLGV
jgi:hypothetical protein